MSFGAGNLWSLLRSQNIDPEKVTRRYVGAVDNPAFTGGDAELTNGLPTDHFIFGILLRWAAGTLNAGTYDAGAGDLAINTVQLVGDGNKYFKNYDWTFMQEVMKMNREPATAGSTTAGFAKMYFVDPRILEAKPLPSWLFTNLSLKLNFNDVTGFTTGAASETVASKIHVTLLEGMYDNQDLSNWRVLVEKFPIHKKYGTNTGEQLYQHERSYKTFDLLYRADDNGTASNTAFDYMYLKARTRKGETVLENKSYVADIREFNYNEFRTAMATGHWALSYPTGLPTHRYTSLDSYLDIPSAGTNVGVKVLERYIL
jgi:hypothetical protein